MFNSVSCRASGRDCIAFAQRQSPPCSTRNISTILPGLNATSTGSSALSSVVAAEDGARHRSVSLLTVAVAGQQRNGALLVSAAGNAPHRTPFYNLRATFPPGRYTLFQSLCGFVPCLFFCLLPCRRSCAARRQRTQRLQSPPKK